MRLPVLVFLLLGIGLGGCLDEPPPVREPSRSEPLRAGSTLVVDGERFHVATPEEATGPWGERRQMLPLRATERDVLLDLESRSILMTTTTPDGVRRGPGTSCRLPDGLAWIPLLAHRELTDGSTFNVTFGHHGYRAAVALEEPLTLELQANGTRIMARYGIEGPSRLEGIRNVTAWFDQPGACTGPAEARHEYRVHPGRDAVIPLGAGPLLDMPDRQILAWPPQMAGERFVFPLEEAVAALEADDRFQAFAADGALTVRRLIHHFEPCRDQVFLQSWKLSVQREDGATFDACVDRFPGTLALVTHAEERSSGLGDRTIVPTASLDSVLRSAFAQFPSDEGRVRHFEWRQPEPESIGSVGTAVVAYGGVTCNIGTVMGEMSRCVGDP